MHLPRGRSIFTPERFLWTFTYSIRGFLSTMTFPSFCEAWIKNTSPFFTTAMATWDMSRPSTVVVKQIMSPERIPFAASGSLLPGMVVIGSRFSFSSVARIAFRSDSQSGLIAWSESSGYLDAFEVMNETGWSIWLPPRSIVMSLRVAPSSRRSHSVV